MIAVIVTEIGKIGSILAVGTREGTEMLMTGGGKTVDKMSLRLLSFYMDSIRTSMKKM